MTRSIDTARANVTPLKTGIDGQAELAKALTACVADSYVLMIKTQGYHWNVAGPLFKSVHELTEEHYQDLFGAIDEMAERIRALGYPAPVSAADMTGCSRLEEETDVPDAGTILKTLVADHETVTKGLRSATEQAEADKDVATADLLTERIAFHEKAIWMLGALAA